ncbi:plastid movement impaired protein [Arabidopsis thaliana]|jgi:hypothetical protein|uniref:At2g01340 n=1 Tax=Arabidopsis thaliana TaxID=3702 RepID=Q52K81_ARATH|nr:plastid movement impaired protein [Arabidopsis thaliana]AAY17424.1 At2g01340 [Arabidopsis thaliana]ABF19028.1 At2g01340 [Arabidopsis thaliana]AEC05438.1 plastid movement impaired protein [Arabidopsis thaliana]BAE98639.1 hypothetical protein [Arabidopsis thaliana]|eukprot:NP_178243.2 plastid movement impaired protein [Arabidopsis thaliana]
MGNSLGGKKTTKVMKIDGETFKLKTPVTAEEVLKDFPGHVLLDSESVKHYGARAKPLEAKQRLEAKRLYFVVEPVKECPPRRVRSGIHVSAKERLESLMLARRSSSDLSILKPPGGWTTEEEEGAVRRVKVRIPKAELEKLVKEGATEAEATQKIAALFMAKQRQEEAYQNTRQDEPATTATATATTTATRGVKSRLKRVSFMAERGGGSEITVA